MTDTEIKNFKIDLEHLRTAYSETLAAFHSCRHRSALIEINKALFALNQAIKDLEEAIKI